MIYKSDIHKADGHKSTNLEDLEDCQKNKLLLISSRVSTHLEVVRRPSPRRVPERPRRVEGGRFDAVGDRKLLAQVVHVVITY